MAMKLYVGNLSWGTTDANLNELFAQYGELEDVFIMKDKFSGRSKGFGFVTFVNDEDGQKAIAELNGKELDGRPLTVDEARPPKQDGGGFRGGNGGGGGRRF